MLVPLPLSSYRLLVRIPLPHNREHSLQAPCCSGKHSNFRVFCADPYPLAPGNGAFSQIAGQSLLGRPITRHLKDKRADHPPTTYKLVLYMWPGNVKRIKYGPMHTPKVSVVDLLLRPENTDYSSSPPPQQTNPRACPRAHTGPGPATAGTG